MVKEGCGGVGGNSTLPVPLAPFRLVKSNPPVPPCQGGKGHAPRRGGGRKAPLTDAPDEGVEEKPP